MSSESYNSSLVDDKRVLLETMLYFLAIMSELLSNDLKKTIEAINGSPRSIRGGPGEKVGSH